MTKKILSIIPARGGSKGLLRKNILDFLGKPLIAWTIEQALKSNVSRVIVTTDCSEIQDVALKYGAEVPYLRSKLLATSEIGIEPVIRDVLNNLSNEEGYEPDCVVLLMPTAPFRIIDDINESLDKFNSSNYSSVFTVSKAVANNNPYWMLKRESNNIVMFNGEPLRKMIKRRQDLPEFYYRNDFVYVLNPSNLYKTPPELYGDTIGIIVTSDDREDVDINSELDWKVAEVLYEFKLNE